MTNGIPTLRPKSGNKKQQPLCSTLQKASEKYPYVIEIVVD